VASRFGRCTFYPLYFSQLCNRIPRNLLKSFENEIFDTYLLLNVELAEYSPITIENKVPAKNKLTWSRSTKRPASQTAAAATELPIPLCACGSRRIFEFQILPSLLHLLDVDRYSGDDEAAAGGNITNIERLLSGGGMNWGNIAVFTCSNVNCSVKTKRDEYVVVQASVEGPQWQESSSVTRRRPLQSYEPVVIAEGTDFGADEDDDTSDDDDEDRCEDKDNKGYD